jgi:hypothetical protein
MREFVPGEVNSQYLIQFHRQLTAPEAQRATADYIGKWIEIAERVKAVIAEEGAAEVSLQGPWIDGRTYRFPGYNLSAVFRSDIEEVSLVRPGEHISFQGRIISIDKNSLLLSDCELLRRKDL